MKTYQQEILGQKFIFDYRRGIFWEEKKLLFVTDLHWGKTDYFRKHGVAISNTVFENDLIRLSELIQDYRPHSLIVLGDLIHHEKCLNDELIETIARFRHTHPVELILIKGNHDRFTQFPESWAIVEERDLIIGNFCFTHDHKKSEKKFQFSGHIHPMLAFKNGPDFIKVPAFFVRKNSCLLPAFSELTGGRAMRLEQGERALAIYEDGIEFFEKNRDQE